MNNRNHICMHVCMSEWTHVCAYVCMYFNTIACDENYSSICEGEKTYHEKF